ncbi:unnamed protein product, partial [Darwinula stevensoni]
RSVVLRENMRASEIEDEFLARCEVRNFALTRATVKDEIFRPFWPQLPLTAEQCRNATFVTTESSGRLGNWIGEKYGKIPVLSGILLDDLLPLFPYVSLRRIDETGCPKREWSKANVRSHYGTVVPLWNDTEFIRDKDVKFTGASNDFGLFDEFKADWMPDFTFSSTLLEQIQEFLSIVSGRYGRDVTYVGIHVRRTDKIKSYRDKGHDRFCGLMFPNIVFIVASDDTKWCTENIKSVDETMPIVFVEGKGRDFDFAVLCHCNHSIISYGTFSFFSAYIAGGLVISPKMISEKVLPIDLKVTDLDNWIFVNG